MAYLRNLALASAVALALAPTLAIAADMPLPPPPMPFVEEFGGWYLRGDIGMTNQKVKKLDNVLFDSTVVVHQKEFDSSPLFGVGVGYKFNNWFRVDGTAEYRGKSSFQGLDTYTFDNGVDPAFTRMNDYRAMKSEWLFLANAYVDLGTWSNITPFVGAGIGTSRNTISSFRDFDPTVCSGCTPPVGPALAYANSASKWQLAWALHAGVAYQVTPNFTIELAYRYLNLGDGVSGDLIAFDGTNSIVNPMHFKDITSHDIRLGVRWMFADNFMPAPYSEPIIRKY